ncbi:MAG: (2Fe-2S)-binding protein [Planctomycetes bacterium]|nr:(2Fe-2S)-binding protein [Planctomycetota bacterium]
MSDPVHRPDPRENLICRCYQVTEATIRQAIEARNLRTVEAVTARTNAAGGCSSCYDDVQDILDQMHGSTRARRRVSPLTNAQKRTLILALIRDDIRPLFRLNDMDIHVLGVQDDQVFARTEGPLVGTTLPSVLTLKWHLVKMMSEACGQKMQFIEMNMLDRRETTDPN